MSGVTRTVSSTSPCTSLAELHQLTDAYDIPLLEDLGQLSGRRVLVRTDFNVPMRDGQITDDLRIRAALPTIGWLQDQGATVVVVSHLGRPDGVRDPAFSMEPVRRRLAELAPGIELRDNLRFDPGEVANDPSFVTRLVDGFDAYVNDAFGASHRAHASIVGPSATLPSAAGRLLEKEVAVLGAMRSKPKRPFVAVLGGAKVSDKIGVIEAMADIVDQLIVGGAMCFTFFKAMGHSVGDSLCEDDQVETAARLLASDAPVLLPNDITALGPDKVDVRQVGRQIPDGWIGYDIGPGSAAEFSDAVMDARTVFWNGPMGMFEDPRFAGGTRSVAQAMADTRAFTVAGGGDSAAAIAQFGLAGELDHISTGGGAALELLENGDLPGLVALRRAPNARR